MASAAATRIAKATTTCFHVWTEGRPKGNSPLFEHCRSFLPMQIDCSASGVTAFVEWPKHLCGPGFDGATMSFDTWIAEIEQGTSQLARSSDNVVPFRVFYFH